ncbi:MULTISPECIES: MerR family transcriptional regulator [unclassified Brevundimonas]|uniref:MerR family transcriptional regulator n=1 Tax=unclassified Brevundimonas TaxID=2622653 RepID=UPI000E94E81E|nr:MULTISPECIES: MerR family transcriptional regulator [unclassified Brevundimonas]HBY44353.1 MerR family transcriptional regulator [Brevundimonas sp.]
MAKSPKAFRTISEAADEVGAPQHVLRFWETKFDFIAPVKRAGGRRFYRPDDVMVLKAVRRLLHDEGLTIRGVQRLVQDQGLARLTAYADPTATLEIDSGDRAETTAEAAPIPVATARLEALLSELETAKAQLEAVLRR